ncbi:MAG: PIN domain-containing protein [Propionibacteriaceae bacterium]|jgi:predicted nucleic acid-binding protein|nr:PIN domain-containing protein [Propionibacteriaceae bacterium]
MTTPIVAVLDTIVVVSAFLTPGGPPGRILGALGWRAFIPAYDARVIAEYRTVLSRPRFGLDLTDVDRFITQFMNRGWAIEPTVWTEPMVDESDRVFVEVAKAAACILVTGNMRHFPAEDWVVSPADFWAVLLQMRRS